MSALFFLFKINGIQFLAVPQIDGAHVVDAAGNNYGKWLSIESFKKNFKAGNAANVPVRILGNCRLSIIGA